MPKYVLKALVGNMGEGGWKAEIPGIPIPPAPGRSRDEALKAAQKAAQTFLRNINDMGDGTPNPEPYAVTVVLDVNPAESNGGSGRDDRVSRGRFQACPYPVNPKWSPCGAAEGERKKYMTNNGGDATITVTLPAEIIAKIEEVGRNKGCSESGVLRDALTIYLDNWEWYDTLLRNEEYARSLGFVPDDVERLIDEYREEVRAENHSQA